MFNTPVPPGHEDSREWHVKDMAMRKDVRMRVVSLALLSLLLTACTLDSTPDTTVGPRAGSAPTDLPSAKAAWEAAGIDSYTLVVTITGCMACGGPDPFRTSTTVTNGEVTDRTVPPGMRPRGAPVVEDLFKWIEFAGP